MNDFLTLSGAAYDVQSVNTLKSNLAKDPQQGLRQVAQQMEGLFVQMMLKSMRSALPKDGMLNSEQTHLYTSIYDQQIAQNIAQKGLGFGDMILKQLSNTKTAPSEIAGKIPMTLDNEVLQTLPRQALEQFIRRTAPKLETPPKPLPLNNANFVSTLSVPAQIASQRSGIPHLLIIAQAALESGWGQREILTADGKPSHNLFGIKAGKDWKGSVTHILTTEYINGEPQKMKDSFRVYGSYVEAITDYVKLLTESPRYAKVVSSATPEQGAYSLQQAGYATDPGYAKKLVSVIQQLKGVGEQAVKAYTHDLSELF
ncbi:MULTISPECIES: flagellar assembly peptidoglycan hydrolase FlgJ [Photorhabdus]|uniref:Peptidoglycan hydrolase FlgJ n=2 Tax=Photorhabdus asymbiotica TaxID=291112 RepID=C7BNW6_PHOAA|nr:flagellar protein FlgJ [Photorhabdus asymbiotica]CAQ84735.1 peptidoglycan hydrolase [Photorhabdus asymbiotica]